MGRDARMPMHAGQLTVSTEAVRELVGVQFPQWQDLPVSAVASHGTVNAIFRLGAGLAARFPLQPADAASTRRWLEAEAAAARLLVGRTRFGTPEPIAIGEPGAGYPLPWSVQTWLPGTVATEQDPGESVAFARDLADFVHDVRAIDTGGRTFDGTNRGGDLRSRDAWMDTCFQRSEELPAAWRLPTPRSTWWVPGTSWRPVHGGSSGPTWVAMTCNGPAAPPGPSNRRSAWSGTTRTAIRS